MPSLSPWTEIMSVMGSNHLSRRACINTWPPVALVSQSVNYEPQFRATCEESRAFRHVDALQIFQCPTRTTERTPYPEYNIPLAHNTIASYKSA